MKKQLTQLQEIITAAQHIVIIQADNPDADSLASALALEQILHKMGKNPLMYCGVDVQTYLRYLPGWDRVSNELPRTFDASIVVDASSINLLEKLADQQQHGWLASKPCIVLDHHATTGEQIDFASVIINEPTASSTAEVIYDVSKALDMPLDETSGMFIMSGILGDTQGLTNTLTSAHTYTVMAQLTELGVNRTELEERRRELSKMPESIYRYKGKLIERTEFQLDGQLALLVVPYHEIVEYSPLYNPAPLIQGDMLQTEGVGIAVVLKSYDNGRITAAIRANNSHPIAGKLAEHFGGGGHDYASGFKITEGRNVADVKNECIKVVGELLAEQTT